MEENDNTPSQRDILDVNTGVQRHFLITEVSGFTTSTEASVLEDDVEKARDGTGVEERRDERVEEGRDERVVEEGMNERVTGTKDGTDIEKTTSSESDATQSATRHEEMVDGHRNHSVQADATSEKNNIENVEKSGITIEGNTTAQVTPPPPEKVRSKLAQELDRLQEQDDIREERAKRKFRRDVRRTKRAMDKALIEKGVELYPDIDKTKAAIKKVQTDEEKFALTKDRAKLDAETDKLKHEIDDKFGILLREKRPDITSLAENVFSRTRGDSEFPSHITRVLTRSEIEDLRLVFGMFDVKGKGYINDKDIKRIVKMLGFRASTKVFDGMIRELAGDTGRVSFVNFLEFIIKSQGEGPDPFDEIKQAFELLDEGEKGFVTFEDLRQAVDDNKLTFSNQMLKEMMQDADKSGDGKLTLQEYTQIMLHTSRFKFA
ncbi:uncharacterized protein LOC110456492 [Mizuhopecten yessoensis]|uniref:Centrin-1 n=1 Tax=Mizuhopecten yessoensis TaxID=6573 RepID=A0A210QAY5_MIZYE|nr:uncharacterized protein LOC110456492 [Mizuhopecten yessoensis]XP_021362954.1 uncharacterized protein LOC110456492 [Mizuhopecten yessoensis]XP_021362955.1 uncharacterized protein LOC110456492 [Mizuhopecten yessoensis]OWF45892.1 Centrin-1 [Mizuhopecten yessoensis]